MPEDPIGYYLDQRDRDTFNAMVRWWRRNEFPPPPGPQPPVYGETPENYITITPSGGISAMTVITPGSATCTIWKPSRDNYTGAVTLVTVATNVTVYNVADSVIPANKYVVVHLVFGFWVASETGFGGFSVGITTTGVTARSSTILGYGSVQPKRQIAGELASDGSVITTVYNTFSATIPTSTYVEIELDRYGDWFITSADC